MARPKVDRSLISAHILSDRRAELEAIYQHHHAEGRTTVSRTQILEQLIHKEARRLKLCFNDSAGNGTKKSKS